MKDYIKKIIAKNDHLTFIEEKKRELIGCDQMSFRDLLTKHTFHIFISSHYVDVSFAYLNKCRRIMIRGQQLTNLFVEYLELFMNKSSYYRLKFIMKTFQLIGEKKVIGGEKTRIEGFVDVWNTYESNVSLLDLLSIIPLYFYFKALSYGDVSSKGDHLFCLGVSLLLPFLVFLTVCFLLIVKTIDCLRDGYFLDKYLE